MLILAEILLLMTHRIPYGMTVQQVLCRNGASCGQYMTVLPNKPRYMINLKLHHRQMHDWQSTFLKQFQDENDEKSGKKYASGT